MVSSSFGCQTELGWEKNEGEIGTGGGQVTSCRKHGILGD